MSAIESKVETRDIAVKIKLIDDFDDPLAQEVTRAVAQAGLAEIDTQDITVFVASITPSTSRLGINAVTNSLWNTNGVVKMILINNGHSQTEINRMNKAASWRLQNERENRFQILDFDKGRDFANRLRQSITNLTSDLSNNTHNS